MGALGSMRPWSIGLVVRFTTNDFKQKLLHEFKMDKLASKLEHTKEFIITTCYHSMKLIRQ